VSKGISQEVAGRLQAACDALTGALIRLDWDADAEKWNGVRRDIERAKATLIAAVIASRANDEG
jgi:hypothetical protein